MGHFNKIDRQTLEIGKHHRKIEKEKGFIPPPPLLIPEIGKLFETVCRIKLQGNKKMSYTRRAVFRALDRFEVVSQQDVARFAHISAPSVSVELADMEKEGLICRSRDEKDGRIMNISITPKGKEEKENIKKSERELAELIQKGMTEEEEKILSQLLLGVRNRLLDALLEIEEMEGDEE